jgi:hypothetical protein
MKKWGVILLVVIAVAGLYLIEISKINTSNSDTVPTLDQLKIDNSARNWDDFYRVRANLIDGQSAEFSIPENLKEKEGSELELNGACVFFSPGCKEHGGDVAVHSFFLLPTLGLAIACEHLPDVAMRWTIKLNLKNDWIVSRTDMIDALVKVKGTFRIDKSKPYEAAFFMDNSSVEFDTNMEEGN